MLAPAAPSVGNTKGRPSTCALGAVRSLAPAAPSVGNTRGRPSTCALGAVRSLAPGAPSVGNTKGRPSPCALGAVRSLAPAAPSVGNTKPWNTSLSIHGSTSNVFASRAPLARRTDPRHHFGSDRHVKQQKGVRLCRKKRLFKVLLVSLRVQGQRNSCRWSLRASIVTQTADTLCCRNGQATRSRARSPPLGVRDGT